MLAGRLVLQRWGTTVAGACRSKVSSTLAKVEANGFKKLFSTSAPGPVEASAAVPEVKVEPVVRQSRSLLSKIGTCKGEIEFERFRSSLSLPGLQGSRRYYISEWDED